MSENASGEADSGNGGDDNNASECRVCGVALGAGYLCDSCDGDIAQT